MKKLEIIIQEDFVYPVTANDLVTMCFIEYDGVYFPFNEWTDLTANVLDMWAYEILQYKYSDDASFRLIFMDGDFWMNVHKGKDLELTIDCINARGAWDVSVLKFTYGYFEFVEALYKAYQSWSYILYTNNMNDVNRGLQSDYDNALEHMKDLKDVLDNRDSKLFK